MSKLTLLAVLCFGVYASAAPAPTRQSPWSRLVSTAEPSERFQLLRLLRNVLQKEQDDVDLPTKQLVAVKGIRKIVGVDKASISMEQFLRYFGHYFDAIEVDIPYAVNDESMHRFVLHFQQRANLYGTHLRIDLRTTDEELAKALKKLDGLRKKHPQLESTSYQDASDPNPRPKVDVVAPSEVIALIGNRRVKTKEFIAYATAKDSLYPWGTLELVE